MFIGIDEVVLSSADIESALTFFEEVLAFERADDLTGSGTELAGTIAGAPDDGVRSVLLTKGAAAGGLIRVVTWPGHEPSPAHLSVRDLGFYAITLYARDIQAHLDRATELGFGHTGANNYVLPGSDFMITEAVIAGPDGLNVALVEYLPAHHRCMLAEHPELTVSEVATSGQMVADVDSALALYRDALGAHVYLDGHFGGPGPERMSGLSPGETMRVLLIRGPTSANARFELIDRVAGGTRAPEPSQGALAISVTDLDETVARLSELDGVRVLPDRSKWGGVCLETPNQVLLELRRR